MNAARVWPLAIAGVLAVTVVANVVLLRAASGPDAATPEPDYYRRALAWDSTQAERARSARLGWRSSSEFTVADGTTHVRVTLRDSLGVAVRGASVTATGVHNLAPTRPEHWTLVETDPGRYEAAVSLPHGGRWEVTVAATRDSERFVGLGHAESPGAGR